MTVNRSLWKRQNLANSIHLLLDGKSYELGLAKHPEYWEVGVEGERFLLNVVDPRKKSLRIASGEGEGLAGHQDAWSHR